MKKAFDKEKLLAFAGGPAAGQRAAGRTGEAKILESRANTLEQSAARLLKEYEKQQAIARKKRK